MGFANNLPSMSSAVFIMWCLILLIPMGYSGSAGFEDNLMAVADSDEMLSLMRDELKNLRIDLTKSFVADHTRRKRDALGFTYEATISERKPTFQTKIHSKGHTSCVFKHQILIFQNNGIYKLVEHSQSQFELVKVSEWDLKHGDVILHTYEWEDTLFILTSSNRGSYSRLSTLQPDFSLIPRQQIKNDGNVTAAQFFHYKNDLYLAVAIDDASHSLAVSLIYRWSRTYMDQIHEIQTRGASAVLAFTVNSYTYIAIAQSQDAAGNYEVGTVLVRMVGKNDLEKVQLLWSYNPSALVHFKILHEDFLIIAQRNLPSITYWFGGYDFTFWEAPDGHFGKNIFLDSITFEDGEPLVSAVNERNVKFITRASSRSGENDLTLNSTNIVYSVEPTEKIVNAKFLKSTNEKYYLALTVSQNSAPSEELQVFEITLNKVAIGKSQEKDRDDELSKCLINLKTRLDHDDPNIDKLEGMNAFIINKNKDVEYTGSLVVTDGAIILPSGNTFDSTTVQPDIPAEEQYTLSPSQLLALANKQTRDFDSNVKPKLDKVLLKSVPGSVTGDKSYTKSLKIVNLDSSTRMEIQKLNGHDWSDIESNLLRFDSESHQNWIISGEWKVETLSTENFQGIDRIGDVQIDDFLLTSCENSGKQIIQGECIFKSDVHFNKGLKLGPSASINDVLFSDISLRSDSHSTRVGGFKHADFINGGDGFEAFRLNGFNLKKWWDSMMSIEGADQFSTGLKKFSNLRRINSVQVTRLNGRDWDEFLRSILISGPDQSILGDVEFKHLMAAVLNAESINSKHIKDLFTTTTDQNITSDIIVSKLNLRRNIETGRVNGIDITDAVRKTENAEIQGQVQLEKFIVTDVNVNDEVTISSVDISEAAKLRKTHVYHTANSEPVHITSGDVGAVELHSSALNGIEFEDFHNSFWRVDAQNEIPEDFDFGGAGTVFVTGEFTTGTLNKLNLKNDVVTTVENEAIHAELQFSGPVTSTDDINCLDGVTMNDFDFSEVFDDIIRTTDKEGRTITGHKRFHDAIEVKNGLIVKELNGKILEKDVVVTGAGHQKISGKTKFQEVSAEDVTSATDVKVEGTVNGENLKSIAETTASHDHSVIIQGNVVFRNGIEAHDLHVEKEINHKPFNETVSRSIDLSKEQTIPITLTIQEGTLQFSQNAIVRDINGIRPDHYLATVVNKNADAVIEGKKQFKKLTLQEDLEGCTKINGIDILELLKHAFSKTRDQTITGKLNFQEVHTEDNLDTERIGGTALSDLAQTDQSTHIASNVVFTNKETQFEEIQLSGLFKGFKLQEILEGLKTLRGDRRFNEIIVEGDLSWENSNEKLERLSYLFENSVTVDTDQTLSHKITFGHDLTADSIQADRWINGIDLIKIKEDGVFRDQSTTFTGRITFLQSLEASRSVEVSKKLNVNSINSVSLQNLNKQVVRSDSASNEIIRGMKTLENGFNGQHITVDGSIDNIRPEDLVVKGDDRAIDRITLTDAKITNDVNYEVLHGDKFKFLNQRVTLGETQNILGNYIFEKDVIVKECSANPINGIFDSDVLLRDSQFRQHIRGKKTFRNDVKIDGAIHGTAINGISLDKMVSQIFRLSENEVFDRPVIFHDEVHVKNVSVTNGINTFDFKKAQTAFSTQLQEIIEPIHVSKATREKALFSIDQLGELVKSQGFWFDDYLVPKKHLNTPGTRVEYFVSEDKTHVKIALHRQVPVGESLGKCDLPRDCLCKSIQFFELDEKNVVTKVEPLIEGVNVFNVEAPSGLLYTATSQTMSYNETCTSNGDLGVTKISSGNIKNVIPLGEVELGYLKDVKAFSDDDNDYLVLASFYNPKSRSHKADVLVIKVSTGRIAKVQAIPGNGAVRLALEKVDNNTWVLAVANSRAGSAPEDCRTTSKIYYWSRENEKFVHVKNVNTIGASDTIILNVPKYTEFHDSFVIFAENGADYIEESGNLGKVSIHAFEKPTTGLTPTYSLFQTLDFKTPVNALYGISIQKISYLFVVTNYEIQFYKYLHFEGFKKWGSVPINGVMDTNAILWKEWLFFVVASTENSLVTKAITSGSPNEPF